MLTLLASYTLALSPSRVVHDGLIANETHSLGVLPFLAADAEDLSMQPTLSCISSGEDPVSRPFSRPLPLLFSTLTCFNAFLVLVRAFGVRRFTCFTVLLFLQMFRPLLRPILRLHLPGR